MADLRDPHVQPMLYSGILDKVLGLKVQQKLSSSGHLQSVKISAPRHIKELMPVVPEKFKNLFKGQVKAKMPMSKKFSSAAFIQGKLCGIDDQQIYKKILGACLCIANVRPDISFAVGQLSRFASCPTEECLCALIQGVARTYELLLFGS